MDRRPHQTRRSFKYNYKSLSPYPEIQEMMKLGLISIISVLLPSYRFVSQEQFVDILEHSSFQFSVSYDDRDDIEGFAQRNEYRGNFYDNVNNNKFRRDLYYMDSSGQVLVPGNIPLSRKEKLGLDGFGSGSKSTTSIRVMDDTPIRNNDNSNRFGSDFSSLVIESGDSSLEFLSLSGLPSKSLEDFSAVTELTDNDYEKNDKIETSVSIPFNQSSISSFDNRKENIRNEDSLEEDVMSLHNEEEGFVEEDSVMEEIKDSQSDELSDSSPINDVNLLSGNRIMLNDSSESMDTSQSATSDIFEEDYLECEKMDLYNEGVEKIEERFERGIIGDEEYNNLKEALRLEIFGENLSVLEKMLGFRKDGIKLNKMYYHNKSKEHKLRFRSLDKDWHFVSHLRIGKHPDYRSKVTNFFKKYVDNRISRFKNSCSKQPYFSYSFNKNSSSLHVRLVSRDVYDMYRLNSLVRDIRYKLSLI